jgi:hypothetical protein
MNTQTRRKVTRLGLAAAAVALVAGAAGGGALTTAQSSITDNKWETTASKPAPGPTVSVTGTPFDAKLDKDTTTAKEDWVITNNSKTQSATLSGLLKDLRPSANADDVAVNYEVNVSKTTIPQWKAVSGGTLANPKAFTLNEVLPDGKNTIDPGQSIVLRVVTQFRDPRTGVTANDNADFALTYQFS